MLQKTDVYSLLKNNQINHFNRSFRFGRKKQKRVEVSCSSFLFLHLYHLAGKTTFNKYFIK